MDFFGPKPSEPALDEVPVRVSAESKVPQRNFPGVPRPRAPRVESRRVYIRQEKKLKKYGYTEGCPGCTAAATGTKAKGHSDACRQRVEEEMEAEEEGRQRHSATLLRKQMFSSAAATATAAPATAATTDSSSGVGRRSGLEARG